MPWIELEGAVNVRDLGGLPAENGGKTVAGRLLRSDNLQELTPSDIARLVRTRRDHDRGPAQHGRAAPPRAPRRWTPSRACGTRTTRCCPSWARPRTWWPTCCSTRADQDRSRYPGDPVAGHYLGYLEDRPGSGSGRAAQHRPSPGAALVHCAAGKDRTGVVVAVALTVAGVPAGGDRRRLRRDGGAHRADRRPAAPVADLRRRHQQQGRPVPPAAAGDHAAFLEQVDARHGGVTAWLAGHGFGTGDLELLAARLRQS